MKPCPNCYAMVDDNLAFCTYCGTKLPADNPGFSSTIGSAPYRAPAASSYSAPAASSYSAPASPAPVPSYAVTGSSPSRQSGVSIAALILSAVAVLLFAIGAIMISSAIKEAMNASRYSYDYYYGNTYYNPYDLISKLRTACVLLIIAFSCFTPGMICSIVGCAQDRKNKSFAIIGLVLSAILALAVMITSIVLLGNYFNGALYSMF